MRPLNLLHRVGPPTWKRSGTLVFSAVMGVLLVGGTAMAANLGLLTFTAPGDRGHRLEVPRPPLYVTLPTTESAPPVVDSTLALNDVEDTDAEVDDDGTDNPPAAEVSTTENSDDESADDDDSDDDREGDDADDGSDVDDESRPDRNDRRRAGSDAPGGKTGVSAARADGTLDDD